MRTPIIAGNWKMYKTHAESLAFVEALLPEIDGINGVDKVVCPTFIALAGVAAALAGSSVKVGAQNAHWSDEGAFTSQIASKMLVGLASYAIIGHSECRQYLGETDQDVNRKAHALLAHGITPIIAVGESLARYEEGETHTFVSGQVRAALEGISADAVRGLVIAYEPIWAIGTGKSATADLAQQIVSETVRATVAELYGAETAAAVRIQYGGSVNPENMSAYMSQPDIDGALIGGASLDVAKFTKLIRIAAESKGASS